MKTVTFQLPGGVQIPDGVQVGDTFQAMTTYCLLPEGKVQLEEVDGESLDPKKEESDEPNDAANDDTSQPGPSVLRNLVAGMQGGQ